MFKKILSLALIFAAAPCFAAPGALDQLETGAGGSLPAVRSGIPPAAAASEFTDPAEEAYYKSLPPTQPIAAGKTYEAAAAEFKAYRESKRAGIKNEDNLPFLLSHGSRARRTVLMIHGLTDSPWYMRALGEKLYQQGYNVVSILLPGHGTRPEDLLHVKELQWQQEVDRGLNIAAGLGERISLAGFSTGGALSLDALRRHPELRAENVFLFSPALAMNEADQLKVAVGCQVPWITAHILGEYRESNPETIIEDNPYYYNKMAVNGVCQLYYLTRDVQRGRAQILRSIGSGTRVFAAQSAADRVVSPAAVTKFMASLPAAAGVYTLYPAAAGIAHNVLPRPENNPFFPELLLKLQAFTAR